MVELGQIEKPSAERFAGKRRLYCVPNVYPLKDAGDEYERLFDRYWDDASKQIERLEVTGKVRKVFCESIYAEGEEALEVLARINHKAHMIIKKKIEEGAVLKPIENREIFGSYIDWKSCLTVVRTQEVSSKILEFYTEVSQRRLQHIQKVIEANISEGEAGLLIMVDEDRMKLQFPSDIEIFLVTPPSYDDLLRWAREKYINR